MGVSLISLCSLCLLIRDLLDSEIRGALCSCSCAVWRQTGGLDLQADQMPGDTEPVRHFLWPRACMQLLGRPSPAHPQFGVSRNYSGACTWWVSAAEPSSQGGSGTDG